MKIKVLLCIVVFLTTVSSCKPVGKSPSIETATPTLTLTPIPPTPTITSIPTIVLSELNPSIIGVGTHGNMVCLDYQGSAADLENISFSGKIQQNEKLIENSGGKTVNNNICFEMTDAVYKAGENVSISIIAKSSKYEIQNKEQSYDLGIYNFVPFLQYIYGDSELKILTVPNSNHPNAYDLQPISPDYKDADGHPVYSPCTGNVIRSEIIPNSVDTNNMWIYCNQTGFFIQLGHMNNQKVIGDQVEVGEIIGYLHWEKVITLPHNHVSFFATQTIRPNFGTDFTQNSIYVDLFNPHTQLGGYRLPYSFWLPETLPDKTKELGIFKR